MQSAIFASNDAEHRAASAVLNPMLRIRQGFSGSRDIVLPPYVIDRCSDDPLLAALHITDIGYYPQAEGHYVERANGIGQYVFIYCVEGAGRYWIGDDEYRVVENQYFILPANRPHRYAADAARPWTIYWIHFGGTLARNYADEVQSPQDIRPEIDSRISTRTHIFEEIFQTLRQGYGTQQLHYASCLFHYYLGTLRYVNQFRQHTADDAALASDVVAAALHYMDENIEKRLSLQDFADYVGLSPSHFSHIFQSRVGESPIARYNRLKIDLAAQLLTTTDMKINQISFKVGFEDAYYFSRLFSRLKGVSPKHWRNGGTVG